MFNNSSMAKSLYFNIAKYLLYALFSVSFLHSAEPTNTKELDCAPEYQEHTKEQIWYCPNLPNFHGNLKHELTNIDFKVGKYNCEYRHKSSGAHVQSCSFTSGTYQRLQKNILNKLYGVVSGDGSTPKVGIFELSNGDDYSINKLDLNTLFNPLEVTDIPSYMADEVQTSINETNALLKKKVRTLINDDPKESSLVKSHEYLGQLKDITYMHLVQPYYSPEANTAFRKESTFSNFLAGLVTLNDNMVEGYNEDTGKLAINNEWKIRATAVSAEEVTTIKTASRWLDEAGSWISGVFNTNEANTEQASRETARLTTPDTSEYLINVNSWIDIFEVKLWGYYYNLQRRLDIGYDVISTQFLYIMSLWFILLAGTKTGIGHIINREQGVRVTEENWMKALSMMLGIGVFFISLPTAITPNTTVGTADIHQEMTKNKTIIKYVIRESAEQGANFATMLSDLGLDAFLTFVVKKQNVHSVDEITRSFHENIAELSMYYPAYSIVKECRSLYEVSDADFLNATSPVSLSQSKSWGSDDFFAKGDGGNNISSISYNLCKKAHTIVAIAPKDIFYASAEAKDMMDGMDELMAKAVNQLVINHVAVQDKMGWVNTFNVPVTYFVMKEGDMFLSKGANYDKITENAEKQFSAIGGQDSSALETEDFKDNSSKLRVVWGEAQDEIQGGLATLISWMSSFTLYNILPAFSSIQQGMQGHLDRVYGDRYAKALEDKKAGVNASSNLSSFTSKLLRIGAKVFPVARIANNIPPTLNSFAWRSLIVIASFMFAIYAWKIMFQVVFISTIAIMLLLKTVLYFKDLMLHVVTSVFVVVWAFAKQGGQGEQKMVGFVRDTLVLMIYPSLIVLSAFMFIFIYEMFMVVYSYLMALMLEGQMATISLMTVANSNTDTFSSYMNIKSLGYMSEIIVQLFGFIIAVMTIMQMPEYILKKIGINESESMMLSSSAEKVGQKGEKFANPL